MRIVKTAKAKTYTEGTETQRPQRQQKELQIPRDGFLLAPKHWFRMAGPRDDISQFSASKVSNMRITETAKGKTYTEGTETQRPQRLGGKKKLEFATDDI